MMKALKETVNPYMIRNIYFSNFESCLTYGIILWGEDNESNNIFKFQKKVLRIISGVSSRTSCRGVFKDDTILIFSSLYILEVMCFIKKYKDFMSKSRTSIIITHEETQIYSYNVPVQFFFEES
jgi:hypothetical protein